jgi:asparagine synthase (glutamine-hydrolysing)
MCGILGTLPSTDRTIFTRGLTMLQHRGPDDSRIWDGVDQSITMGHRRLSILDLSESGSQPMHYGDRYSIVFNGEIYNFIELRKELVDFGFKFSSKSDTEVLLASYIKWGEKCLEKFNGMWSFAIWDSLKKTVFLSRDRFGKKPLFYANIKGKFVFSSEMKGIYPFFDTVSISKDIKWLRDNSYTYEGTEMCTIDGIKRFPAGHYGIYCDGDLKIEKYWDTLDNLISVPENYSDQCDMFHDLFVDACMIRMRSDVPIGTALSGGLDSSSVISTIANIREHSTERQTKNWQNAVVACFPGTPLDERFFAEKVVEKYSLNAKFINVNPLSHISSIEKYLFQLEDITEVNPIPHILLYQEMRKSGIKVTLDGHGSDEMLGGYEHSIPVLFKDYYKYPKKMVEIAKLYKSVFPDSDQFATPSVLKLISRFYLRMPLRKIKELVKTVVYSGEFGSQNYKNKLKYKDMDYLTKHLYVEFHHTILPTLLRNYDRYAMMSGVEIRMPFMDHRLVSFVMSLPGNSKIRDGYTKAILRDSMGRYLPDEIRYRKNKIGFASPIVDWMKNDLSEFFLDTVNSRSFKECTLIDASDVRRRVERVIYSDDKPEFYNIEQLWKEIVMYLWGNSIDNWRKYESV